ncbi:hypothetical protein ACTJKQ_12655 [Acidovorax sp. 22279]|uniref:hypothetical protein n=1 Tax=Acidovorax sp. 22279 TaxID=3453900 RepID=UPI003F857D4D
MDFTIEKRSLTKEQRISIWQTEFQPGAPTGFEVYDCDLKQENILTLSLDKYWWEESIVHYSESDLVKRWLDDEYPERQQDMENLTKYLLLTRDKSKTERACYLACLWAERSGKLTRMTNFKSANDMLLEKYPTLDSNAREAIVIDWLSPGFFGELPESILKILALAIDEDMHNFSLWINQNMVFELDDMLGFLVRAHQVDPDSSNNLPSQGSPDDHSGEAKSSMEIEL